jgi:hypothetical protein
METLLAVKLVLAAVIAGVVGWYLIVHAQRHSERSIRRWWRRRHDADEDG